jgi:hypothetical protein
MTHDPIDREVLGRLDFGDPPGELLALLVATFLEHAPANAGAASGLERARAALSGT